jgi:pSer/pThr/pTyr-binding forkhead associated (FHA) protein
MYEFDTQKEISSIGRSSENDFVIDLPNFSRKQCVITIKNDYIFIMDPGSKNGIKIDGNKIPPHVRMPVYANSKILLANNFQLILPGGTMIKQSDEILLDID